MHRNYGLLVHTQLLQDKKKFYLQSFQKRNGIKFFLSPLSCIWGIDEFPEAALIQASQKYYYISYNDIQK
ncbi:MAG: hypothetical protein A2X47_13325 [Lentisphaerae bacterium GWF2_38_69]|nr:MAG: hypothetical protein A2X47_13325 [Lentisphaerae bacterium GWF2_38_69]